MRWRVEKRRAGEKNDGRRDWREGGREGGIFVARKESHRIGLIKRRLVIHRAAIVEPDFRGSRNEHG